MRKEIRNAPNPDGVVGQAHLIDERWAIPVAAVITIILVKELKSPELRQLAGIIATPLIPQLLWHP